MYIENNKYVYLKITSVSIVKNRIVGNVLKKII